MGIWGSRGKKRGRFGLWGYNVEVIISLARIDPELHMNRWYTIAVQPTLLDPVAVICTWGNRKTRYQRMRIQPTSSPKEARTVADGIVRRKVGRGYRKVTS
ncbi:MAG: WGR domain-containing protein [Chloroflexi bacterium]|nr:MAG: WGR domain-containing protein [Chloroflexota bacterium]